MKKQTTIASILLAFVILVIPVVIGVAGPGEVSLNCSYATWNNTPSNNAILISGVPYKNTNEVYQTTDRDEISFRITAVSNSNSTNTTLSSVAAKLYWDGVSQATTNTISGFTNDTGAINATKIFSNETDGTHSYYAEFWIYNHTSFDNITGCASDVTCTNYGVNHASYANLTKMVCPTKYVSMDYKVTGSLPPEDIMDEEKTFVEKNRNAVIIAIIVVILGGYLYFKDK